MVNLLIEELDIHRLLVFRMLVVKLLHFQNLSALKIAV